jgi:hypothetical protein
VSAAVALGFLAGQPGEWAGVERGAAEPGATGEAATGADLHRYRQRRCQRPGHVGGGQADHALVGRPGVADLQAAGHRVAGGERTGGEQGLVAIVVGQLNRGELSDPDLVRDAGRCGDGDAEQHERADREHPVHPGAGPSAVAAAQPGQEQPR